MNFSISRIYILLLGITYFFLVIAMKRDFLSPDSLYFLTTDFRDITDYRYILWAFIVSTLERDLIIFLHVILLFHSSYKIGVALNKNHIYIVLLIFMPSVFYFSSVMLRDLTLLIIANYAIHIIIVNKKEAKSFIALFALSALLFMFRPYYGVVLALIVIFYKISCRWLLKFVLFTLLLVFLLSPIVILFNDHIFMLYQHFMLDGHGRHLPTFGATEIPKSLWSRESAALNFLLSPMFFWILPPSGAGSVLDNILVWESIFLFLCFSFLIMISTRRTLSNFTLLMMIGCAISLFMSVFTYNHGDVIRFRLFFMPFLLLALLSIRDFYPSVRFVSYGIRLTLSKPPG